MTRCHVSLTDKPLPVITPLSGHVSVVLPAQSFPHRSVGSRRWLLGSVKPLLPGEAPKWHACHGTPSPRAFLLLMPSSLQGEMSSVPSIIRFA